MNTRKKLLKIKFICLLSSGCLALLPSFFLKAEEASIQYPLTENAPEAAFLCDYTEQSITFLYRDLPADSSVSITSSNPDVVTIHSAYTSISLSETSGSSSFHILLKNPGTAEINLSVANKNYPLPVCVFPDTPAQIKQITQISYSTSRIRWNPVSPCDGYVIFSRPENGGTYTEIGTVSGSNTSEAKLPVPKWEEPYRYAVVPYVMGSIQKYYTESRYYDDYAQTFTASFAGSQLEAPVLSSQQNIFLKWNETADAASYKLYVSNEENGSYQLAKEITGSASTSTDYPISEEKLYCFKLETCIPGYPPVMSKSVCICPSSTASYKRTKIKNITLPLASGQYQWINWATPESVAYYVDNKEVHIVEAGQNKITDYTLNASKSRVKKKTISLKYSLWGGFYKGSDGYFYVAAGYPNDKENDKKAVIKVIRYDNKWKKCKTAVIRGNASNKFKGIFSPFDAGSCRMTLIGSKLYLQTSRTMYRTSDGLRHQSNISFEINTKNMKAKAANHSYASHSFNQYIKLKDDHLYIANHGDAYPRAIDLTQVTNYGQADASVRQCLPFKLKGTIGQNYTGCTLGGMEISKNNVLMCGSALPHFSSVKGKKGINRLSVHNIFVTVTNIGTQKTSVIWLTTYPPQKSNYAVGEARMVKIDDTHFAVLYELYKKKTLVGTQYVAIDDSGKVLARKMYKKIGLSASAQPILIGNQICYIEKQLASATPYGSMKYNYYFIQLPAIYK